MSEAGLVVTPVDERESAWELEHPTFRVYLQTRGGTHTSATTSTYDVTGGDVLEVVEWARGEAGPERTVSIALVYDDIHREQLTPGDGRGLVWLVGADANRA